MTLEEKLDKVKGKLAKLNGSFKGARGVSEPPEVARKRRKLERKRFKLERAIAQAAFCVKVIVPNTTFEQAVDAYGSEQAMVGVTHPVSKRKLSVIVFTRKYMNAKVSDVETETMLGTTSVARVRIEDNGRLIHNRTVHLQDRKVDIDELLLSNNPLLWDVYTLPEDDRTAFETVKAALISYLEAITPCTVRGQESEDDE